MVSSLPSRRRSIQNLLSEIGGTEDCALKRAMRGGDFVGPFRKRNPRPDALFPASNRTRLPLGMIYLVWHETFLRSSTLRPVPSCAGVVARRRFRCGGRGLRQAGLCRRLSGGRMLDAAIRHHADPARGIPARHDLLTAGSGIRAGPAVLQYRMDHAGSACGRRRRRPACGSSSP